MPQAWDKQRTPRKICAPFRPYVSLEDEPRGYIDGRGTLIQKKGKTTNMRGYRRRK